MGVRDDAGGGEQRVRQMLRHERMAVMMVWAEAHITILWVVSGGLRTTPCGDRNAGVGSEAEERDWHDGPWRQKPPPPRTTASEGGGPCLVVATEASETIDASTLRFLAVPALENVEGQ